MVSITKYIQSIFEDGKRVLQVLKSGKSDVHNGLESAPFGIDSEPPEGMRAIFAPTSNMSKKVVIGYINENQLAAAGETRMYSIDSDGNVVMFLHFKNNGTAEFNGDDDNMVRFNPLESGYDELRSDLNNLITKYNAHTHPYLGLPNAQPGITAATGSTETPSTASIAGAKIDNIKTKS